MYPHLSSTLHNVSGYPGVDLLKYGKPPAPYDFDSVEYAEAMRSNIRFEASHPSSTWQTTAEAPAARFNKQPYATLKMLGGILGGTIPENRAGLRTKVRAELAIKDEDVPAAFDSREQWPACAALIGEIRDQSACGSCYAVSAASAATDRFCIAKEGKVTHVDRLAGANLMDCCKTCAGSNGGCDGGTSRRDPCAMLGPGARRRGATNRKSCKHATLFNEFIRACFGYGVASPRIPKEPRG